MPTTSVPPDDLSWPSEQESASMTVQDWQQYYARRRYREHDATLLALQASLTVIQPPAVALCSIQGQAHDYRLQCTLVQSEDSTLRQYDWDVATQQLCDPQPAALTLDLRLEFQQLRHEPVLLRREAHQNIDRTSASAGRGATLYLVVGAEAEWIEFPSLLHGGVYMNTAINRIFREMMRMQQSITLVDEPKSSHP